MSFKIVTDSGSDISKEFCEKYNIGVMNLSYILDGEIYGHGKEMEITEFYARMRNGAQPTTSQVNPEEARVAFNEFLKESKEILYLGLSSGISGTCGSVRLAAEEIMEERDDVKIYALDPLCASLGLTLCIYDVVQLREQGKSIEEAVAFVNDNMLQYSHLFTVDNLMDLWRGGRVSKTTAIVGTIASIKPILHVDNEGKLIPIKNVRSRKKSIETLADIMGEKMGSKKDSNKSLIAIGYGDSDEDAKYLAEKIKEKYGFENFLFNNIGPVIGSHTGPSILLLTFRADER